MTLIITGPHTHSVYGDAGPVLFCSRASVVVDSTAQRGGPVVLRPVSATPC